MRVCYELAVSECTDVGCIRLVFNSRSVAANPNSCR